MIEVDDLQNKGVTIYLNEAAETDLKHILKVIEDFGKQSIWKIDDLECFGNASEILNEFSDQRKEISDQEFYDLASNIDQTIDGTFEAYLPNENTHWLLIRAIRGDAFDIETDNKELLDKFKTSFQNVRDLIY